MTDVVKKGFACGLFVLSVLAALSGCSEPEKPDNSVFLLKTSAMTVSSFEFSEELDLKRAAYPYNIDEDPAEFNEMVIHLVRILSEELILLNAAADKGIMVTDEEVARAEAEFKQDYPENSFDNMLLVNAIPYRLWKKRFRQDMIIRKLIHQEVEDKIEITSQDIVEYYNEFKAEKSEEAAEDDADEPFEGIGQKLDSETELVSRLRMLKTQEKYETWIQELYAVYPVEINKEALKTFMLELKDGKGK